MVQHRNINKALCLALSLLLVFSMSSTSALSISYPGVETDDEWEMLKIVNRERINEGLYPLSMTSDLQDASHIRVAELAERYSHTRPNGDDCYTVLKEASITYTRAGENITSDQASAEDAMTTWMDNRLNRENIVSTNYDHIGIGYHYDASKTPSHYWQQFFIGSTDNSF